MTAKLESQFDEAMMGIYHRAKVEANYPATVFHRMLVERRGLSTAKYLINAARPSEGYTNLWERKRLDLTVEALILDNPKWHPLFTPAELAKARARLSDYGYEMRQN